MWVLYPVNMREGIEAINFFGEGKRLTRFSEGAREQRKPEKNWRFSGRIVNREREEGGSHYSVTVCALCGGIEVGLNQGGDSNPTD
ncbi:hypothetical protein L484_016746 [Morus notabilis]|uniref:Uncharacterized protein n=1 Tax=Morus notabilis TaxID=981085 RepID=W9R3M3_9ROSA|nr:hypothetical protein L484_016746 [Morus notabilis]